MMVRCYINYGGILDFDSDFLRPVESDGLLTYLDKNVLWEQKYYTNFRTGEKLPQPRQTAWYADDPKMAYSYSGVTQAVQPWLPDLLLLRDKIEYITGCKYNSVLLNHYRNGRDSVGLHADDESELGSNANIASVSLGATRKFIITNYRKDFGWNVPENISIAEGNSFHYELNHGSLLVMSGTTQHYWKHEIPKVSLPVSPRINLTFRDFKV
jgi:alkylated DNA repair dioxygenase AlkB